MPGEQRAATKLGQSMPELRSACFGLLVLAAAGGRAIALTLAVTQPSPLTPVRQAILSGDMPTAVDASIHPAITGAQWQRFDAGAVVAMRPGADGQPGMAGIDDNGNGAIDDVSELGATASDDVCLVADAVEARRLAAPVLILQQGAYVPTSVGELSGDDQARVVVYGRFGDDRWSFLLERW